jgi:hypothetical protein
VCPITLLVIQGGPDGKGYLIKQPKQWLVKIAPALLICLGILKAVVHTYGIPLPLPRILTDAVDGTLDPTQYITEVALILSEMNDDASDIKDTLDSIDENTSDRDMRKCIKNITHPDTQESYHQIFKLLLKLEEKSESVPFPDWKPRKTGLRFVGPSGKDGSFAWVSDDGVTEFMAKGKESFKIPL